MKVLVTANHKESCQRASNLIIDTIKNNLNPVLGLATGATAEQVYDLLVEAYTKNEVSFKNVRTVNLDEYVGLAPDHPQSYRHFMNTFLFNKVDINIKETFVPLGNTDVDTELKKFQEKLSLLPRDLQLLGVGANGHIAFNEPADNLHGDAHIVSIAKSTIAANARYFDSEQDVPKKAFTQGMGDILKAKKLVLLATGESKVDAIRSLILGDSVTTEYPCTFLKLHPEVYIFIDQDLANKIGYKA